MQNNQRKKLYTKFAFLCAPVVMVIGFMLGQDLEYNGEELFVARVIINVFHAGDAVSGQRGFDFFDVFCHN